MMRRTRPQGQRHLRSVLAVAAAAAVLGPLLTRLLLPVLLLASTACTTTPYTNRSQFIVLPESQEIALGAQAFEQVLEKEKVVRDPRITEPVRRVGLRIAEVADQPDYDWEFVVIDDPKQVNAFALPGGKVAVYTGLFPVARDEAGLAAVMGHEVAHAIARHAGERMSQDVLLQFGAVGLQVALGDASATTQQAVMQAFGLGAQVGVMLPFGRSQEAEADHIGMILMAKAGYDPMAALELWQRMEEHGSNGPPEILSTHPSYDTRQENIRGWMDEARGYYEPNRVQAVRPLPEIPGASR